MIEKIVFKTDSQYKFFGSNFKIYWKLISTFFFTSFLFILFNKNTNNIYDMLTTVPGTLQMSIVMEVPLVHYSWNSSLFQTYIYIHPIYT